MSVQIILALSSPAIAGIALWLGGKRQAQGFRHDLQRQERSFRQERELADLKDTRTLLGEAAASLHKADYARMEVMAGYGEHVEKLPEREPEVIPALVEAGTALDALLERLIVHLGAAQIAVQAFHEADGALLEISRTMNDVELDEDDPDILKRRQERRDKIMVASDRFKIAWGQFRQEAHGMVGVRLTPMEHQALGAGEPPDALTFGMTPFPKGRSS